MKNLNNYITERLHITKKTKNKKYDIPDDVNYDYFISWLKEDMGFPKSINNTLQNEIKNKLYLDTDEYTFYNYLSFPIEYEVKKYIEEFPTKNKNSKKIFELAKISKIYTILGYKYITNNLRYNIIFIYNEKTQKVEYAFILNIMLAF